MEFEWDDSKNARNLRKHGVEFREPATAFYDPLALVRSDVEHSHGEQRFILLGRSIQGRLLVTVFTERGNKIRIISSRCATRHEVNDYEERV